MALKKWTETEIPLGEIAFVKLRFGLEETYHENPPLLQVDFANMYLGVRFSSRLSLYSSLTHTSQGGVLSGGCVQEEIRFSISPELIAAMLRADTKPRNGKVEGDEFAALSGEQAAVVRRLYETVRRGL